MKNCKDCWKPRGHNNPLISRCKGCTYKRSEANPKQTRIKQVSSKNKNSIAKFTKETKQEIKDRDKHCILCPEEWTDYHHAYFWPIQANYWPDRNNADQWVLLCPDCHHSIHHWKDWKWKLNRAKSIEYLVKLK